MIDRKHFGDLSEGRNNNFDFLRFFFALCVIFSHSFAFLYNGTIRAFDPLVQWTHSQTAFGGGAVDGFFVISGFLITKSWQKSKSTQDYAMKRVLRIFPALIVVLVFSVFVVGPLSTTLSIPAYLHNSRTYAYFAFMSTINLHIHDQLPGVFMHNPIQGRVNGSLWTIRCEVICYILVAIFGFIGMYRRRAFVLAVSTLAIGLLILGSKHFVGLGEFADSVRVLMYFFCGMTFYLYRDRIPYSLLLLLLSVIGIIVSSFVGVLAYTLPLLGTYALFYVAFNEKLRLQNFAHYGDFSYGLYLYAFPIQQLLVTYFRPLWNVGTLTLVAFVIAGICAVLSWHFVEKPLLKIKPNPKKIPEFGEQAAGMSAEALADQKISRLST